MATVTHLVNPHQEGYVLVVFVCLSVCVSVCMSSLSLRNQDYPKSNDPDHHSDRTDRTDMHEPFARGVSRSKEQSTNFG